MEVPLNICDFNFLGRSGSLGGVKRRDVSLDTHAVCLTKLIYL